MKGRRIYEIPTNGILLTHFKDEYGIVHHQYYYVDGNGKRMPLEIFQDEKFKDRALNLNLDEIGIFLDGTTGQYGTPPNAVWGQDFVYVVTIIWIVFFTLGYKKHFEKSLRKATGIDVFIP